MTEEKEKRSGCLRVGLRWGFRLVLVLVLLVAVAFVIVFRGALYNRFSAFPAEARAWDELRAQAQAVELDDGFQDFRGVLHSHSHFSHDCQVPFEEILQVLKDTGRDFICMSDHCHEGKADFGVQWSGLHDGVLFLPGYEMSHGFMPWGLPRDTVLDCGKDQDALAQEIQDLGGLLFFAHTEEERRWDLPQLVGMEIYNIHTDFQDEELAGLIPDLLLNMGAYPDQTFRLIFDEQTPILERWDELNRTRDITGIAANDCHQNNGIVITYTEGDTLLVRNTAPDDMAEYKLNFFTRLLARVVFGPLEPGRVLFHFQPDPYAVMTNYVSTHVLMNELNEAALLDALAAGRAFVCFDGIVDGTGFTVVARNGAGRAAIGETLPFAPGTEIAGASPVPCRFTVLKHGEPVHEQEGREFAWRPEGPGKYRVEARVRIRGEWVPWIYTNPLELL